MPRLSNTDGDREFVRWNSEELRQHLPRPGRTWTWEESSLAFGTLMKLMRRDLIRRASGISEWETTEWETTEVCWALLIDVVGTSESGIGTGVGQERLLAPAEIGPEKPSRVLAPSRSRTPEPEQVTLTGEEVDVDTADEEKDIDWIQKCREAGKLGDPEVREERRREREPEQTALIEWSSKWDVTVQDSDVLTRPSGAVY